MSQPGLSQWDSDAIVDRVLRALGSLGVRPSAVSLKIVPAGLVIVVRAGDKMGAALAPSGQEVSFDEVAITLVGELEASMNVYGLPTHERQLTE